MRPLRALGSSTSPSRSLANGLNSVAARVNERLELGRDLRKTPAVGQCAAIAQRYPTRPEESALTLHLAGGWASALLLDNGCSTRAGGIAPPAWRPGSPASSRRRRRGRRRCCSTAGRGISLWQNGSGITRKSGVSLSLTSSQHRKQRHQSLAEWQWKRRERRRLSLPHQTEWQWNYKEKRRLSLAHQ